MAPALEQLPPLMSPLGIAGLALVAILVLAGIDAFVLKTPYPPNMPLVGEPPGAKSFRWSTKLRYYNDCAGLFREVYDNYAKRGKAVVMPGLGWRHDVVMPQSSMRFILSQPEHILTGYGARSELDQGRWVMGSTKYVANTWMAGLIRRDLNRMLESICVGLNEELSFAIDQHLGNDTENWTSIDVLEATGLIVAQAASRFTVDVPLCRDREYQHLILDTNELILIAAGVVGSFPAVMRPLVGSLFRIVMERKVSVLKSKIGPLWTDRVRRYEQKQNSNGGNANDNNDERMDIMQFWIEHWAKERPFYLHNLDNAARHMVVQNFGSVHQTRNQAINMLLNVISSDAEFDTMAVLREEMANVLGPDPDAKWTKAKIAKLHKLDSFCRETMRLGNFGGRANMRKVLAADFHDEEGHHLPRGSILSFLGQPAHVDKAVYGEDALKFDPFRFSRPAESEAAAAGQGGKAPATTSFVSTSPEYLVWGHGAGACPGRFLIDFEFKMIMSYLLLNYDVKFPDEYGGKRPENRWMAEALQPPNEARILVKRRE